LSYATSTFNSTCALLLDKRLASFREKTKALGLIEDMTGIGGNHFRHDGSMTWVKDRVKEVNGGGLTTFDLSTDDLCFERFAPVTDMSTFNPLASALCGHYLGH